MKNIKTYESVLAESKIIDLDSKLISSVYTKNIERSKRFLEEGADPDATDKNGNSALGIAALNGSIDIINMLIDWGADPNKLAPDKGLPRNMNPLQLAILFEKLESVKVLLERGADPNMDDSKGKPTILYVRNIKDQKIRNAMAEILLKAGADPTKRDSYLLQMSILDFARKVHQDDPDLLRLILTHSKKALREVNIQEVIDAFGGDEAKVPGELMDTINRMQRGKSAFGM